MRSWRYQWSQEVSSHLQEHAETQEWVDEDYGWQEGEASLVTVSHKIIALRRKTTTEKPIMSLRKQLSGFTDRGFGWAMHYK